MYKGGNLFLHLIIPVADPGPLMLGVLDRLTPTVSVLQTLIAHISFHIELSHRSKRLN